MGRVRRSTAARLAETTKRHGGYSPCSGGRNLDRRERKAAPPRSGLFQPPRHVEFRALQNTPDRGAEKRVPFGSLHVGSTRRRGARGRTVDGCQVSSASRSCHVGSIRLTPEPSRFHKRPRLPQSLEQASIIGRARCRTELGAKLFVERRNLVVESRFLVGPDLNCLKMIGSRRLLDKIVFQISFGSACRFGERL